MKSIDALAYASSAACFAIVIQLGPESQFWAKHRYAPLFLGAGISTGVIAAFLRQTKFLEKPGTLGHRVTCALGVLISLTGIGLYMYTFEGALATGFFGGAVLLIWQLIESVVQPKMDAMENRLAGEYRELVNQTRPPDGPPKSRMQSDQDARLDS